MNTNPKIKLPYFDHLLQETQRNPDSDLVHALATKNVHWGYFSDPAVTNPSLAEFNQATEALTFRLCDAAQISNDFIILDAGCGFGGTIASLNERFTGLDLYGLNIDGRQISRAQTLVTENPTNVIEFVNADACRLPFVDNMFDRVLAVECIFHFPSRMAFFREARRILKTGGKLALSDFVPIESMVLPMALYSALIFPGDVEFYGTYNRYPCSLLIYQLIAKLTGFRLEVHDDITVQTLPTYPLIIRLLQERQMHKAVAVTREIEKVSRKGWIRYKNLVFEAV